jgi:hypothetical protein
MQSLPSELKCIIIAVLSSDEYPESLAALARTHTSFQREAEKALYDNIYIYTSDDDSLLCMETLAKFSEKAGLVRFLTIEYASDNTYRNRRVTTFLSRSLINMHSLSDLRVRSCPGGVEAQSIMKLGKIFWSVYKNLNHLKTNDSAGDTVKVIFDYELFTVTTYSTYLELLRVNLNYSCLDYIITRFTDSKTS